MSSRRRTGFRATERDLEIVMFVGRHRAVEGRQVAERFGMHLSNAHRRLGALVRGGLLEHRRLLHGRPGVYLATRAGLELVGLELPAARVDLRTYEHDVELVWLALELEQEFGRAAVVTERELRSREVSAARAADREGHLLRPRYAVRTGRGVERLHFPDLVVEGGGPRGGLLAVELERTSKGAARRRQIIGAYQGAVQVEQVRYYCRADTWRPVERTVKELRANQVERVFDLRPWQPRAAVAGGMAAAAAAAPANAVAHAARHLHRHHHHVGHHHPRRIWPLLPGGHFSPHVSDLLTSVGFWGVGTGLALGLLLFCSRLRFTWAAPLGLVAAMLALGLAPAGSAGAIASLLCAVAAGAWAWHVEHDNEARGGRHRRRARAKVGPLQWTRRTMERRRVHRSPLGALDLRGPREWPCFWRRGSARLALGETLVGREPVWLSFDQLEKHLLILGATGGGKTNSLLWVTTRAVRAGKGALILDMKADPGLAQRVQAEAGLWGRPFYLFRIEGEGQLYNPLAHGDNTARRDRLTASMTWGEDYYRGLFSAHAKIVLDALHAAGREPTLQALADWWSAPDLQASLRAIDDEQARERLGAYCADIPRSQLEHISSLRARLTEITDTAAGASLRSGASPAEQIDLRDALERRAIVVFSINADSYPAAAATLGNLILQDLVGVVGDLRQARRKVRTLVAIDEFGALSGQQLGRLLSTGRDVGLPVILAGQDLAQLRRVSDHFEAEVKANISGLIAHRQSEPDSAEQIARLGGTEEVIAETIQINRRPTFSQGKNEPGYQTGVGSRHLERAFRIGPDQVKELNNGQAAICLWNPASTHLARIHRCETTEELARLTRITGTEGQRQASAADLLRRADRARLRLSGETGVAS